MSMTENNITSSVSPKVSIIVPVYNVEETLYECLISVVFQSLPETEVIVVNDASPDNSQRIIDEFVQRFPDKVKSIIHEKNMGQSCARKTGLNKATAPYVIFIDSDDFVSVDLCNILVQQMESEALDVLHYPVLRYWLDSRKSEVLYPPRESSCSQMVKNAFGTVFSGAMYNREYLLNNQDLFFREMTFEDAAVAPALLSLTDKIGVYRGKAMYFYRYGRVGSTCTQQMSEKKKNDMLAADDIALKNVADEFRNECIFRVIKRAANNMRKELTIYDYNVFHFRELIKLTDGDYSAYPSFVPKTVDEANSLPDEITIPKIVYVNGFVKEQLRSFDSYIEEAEKAYVFNPEIVVLDETNCDLSALPQWLEGISDEEKGVYFALCSIREKGGIYISPAVKIVSSFNREAFKGAFFVADDNTSVTSFVFGAEPGNYIIGKALEVIQSDKPAYKRESICDCIAHTLIGECGVHLDGKNENGLYGLHILSFNDVFYNLSLETSYCVFSMDNYKNGSELYDYNRLNAFAWLLAAKNCPQTDDKELAKVKKQLTETKKKLDKVNKDFDHFRNSKLYKATKSVYRVFPSGIKKLFWK